MRRGMSFTLVCVAWSPASCSVGERYFRRARWRSSGGAARLQRADITPTSPWDPPGLDLSMSRILVSAWTWSMWTAERKEFWWDRATAVWTRGEYSLVFFFLVFQNFQ